MTRHQIRALLSPHVGDIDALCRTVEGILVACKPRQRPKPQPVPSDPVMAFPVRGGGPDWILGQAQIDEWREAFPALDVLGQCRAALAWVKASPGRQKTHSGMARFLVGWLNRTTNRGQRQQVQHLGRRAANYIETQPKTDPKDRGW